jgi:hypothetical protein
VTVIIPMRECATTIAGVLDETVGPGLSRGLVDELVVVDPASVDGSARIARTAGARVIQQDDVTPERYGLDALADVSSGIASRLPNESPTLPRAADAVMAFDMLDEDSVMTQASAASDVRTGGRSGPVPRHDYG